MKNIPQAGMFQVTLWTLEKIIPKSQGQQGSLGKIYLSQSLSLSSQVEYRLWKELGSLRRNGRIFQKWKEPSDPLGISLKPQNIMLWKTLLSQECPADTFWEFQSTWNIYARVGFRISAFISQISL